MKNVENQKSKLETSNHTRGNEDLPVKMSGLMSKLINGTH